MSSARRDRLEAYLATLRSPAQDTQKRRAANWPLYAAVTGSAMAMATNVPVSSVGAGIRSFREAADKLPASATLPPPTSARRGPWAPSLSNFERFRFKHTGCTDGQQSAICR